MSTPSPHRTERITVRLTPGEREQLEEQARRCGRAVSTFLREAALGAVPRARNTAGESEVLYQLQRIGSHLSRQAHHGEAGDPDGPAPELEATLAELRAVFRRLVG